MTAFVGTITGKQPRPAQKFKHCAYLQLECGRGRTQEAVDMSRRQEQQIREYMRLHGVKYNVARRALGDSSTPSEPAGVKPAGSDGVELSPKALRATLYFTP